MYGHMCDTLNVMDLKIAASQPHWAIYLETNPA